MSRSVIAGLMVVALFLGLATGLPVAFVLGSVAVCFSLALWGPSSLYALVASGLSVLNNYVLLAVPLFILMAMILFRSGVAEDMYDAVHKWSGPVRGGLAMATVVVCTLFAAVSGILTGVVVSMGLIALPSMFKRNYRKDMALGSILGGSTLGPLIPPSVPAIVYGIMAGTSIGGLFAGGLITGCIISFLFIVYIGVRSYIQKDLCPALPKEERPSLKEKLYSLRHLVLPALLIAGVLGAIFTGAATPTEASGIGVLGALICAAIRRRLRIEDLKESIIRCLSLTSMIIWLLIGASAYNSAFLGAGGMQLMESLLSVVPGGPTGVVVVCILIVFILGMLMDQTAIIIITASLFAPIITSLGIDKLWFGIVYLVALMLGNLTPPFGWAMFILKGVAPPEVTLSDLYKAALPFAAVDTFAIALFIAFPWMIMWFPPLLVSIH